MMRTDLEGDTDLSLSGRYFGQRRTDAIDFSSIPSQLASLTKCHCQQKKQQSTQNIFPMHLPCHGTLNLLSFLKISTSLSQPDPAQSWYPGEIPIPLFPSCHSLQSFLPCSQFFTAVLGLLVNMADCSLVRMVQVTMPIPFFVYMNQTKSQEESLHY